jgi:hypothetical protein
MGAAATMAATRARNVPIDQPTPDPLEVQRSRTKASHADASRGTYRACVVRPPGLEPRNLRIKNPMLYR